MTEDKTIFVERDTYEKDGNTYYGYFIRGNVRGKDVRVLIVPPDKGGYTVLDVVFGDEDLRTYRQEVHVIHGERIRRGGLVYLRDLAAVSGFQRRVCGSVRLFRSG